MTKIGSGNPLSVVQQTQVQTPQQIVGQQNVQGNQPVVGVSTHQFERMASAPTLAPTSQEVLRDLGGASAALSGDGQLQGSVRPRSSAVGLLSPLLNAVRDGQSLLQRGMQGEMVSQVQQLLNKAGSQLKVDGQFGPATQQAVRDFQQQHGLKLDGLVGPETLRILESGMNQLGQLGSLLTATLPSGPASTPTASVPLTPTTATPSTTPTATTPQPQPPTAPGQPTAVTGPATVAGAANTSPVGQRVISESLAENGKVSNNAYDGAEYQGWQHLQDTISQATRGPLGADGKHHPPGINYPDSSIRTHPRPIWKDSKGKVHHMDWCGIWATRMFQKAGVNCYWEPGTGVKGDVNKVFSPKPEDIKPGDMIVGPGPLWHHAIVTGIQRDATGKPVAFETMNGNHPGIGPGSMPASNVKAYYRPKE